MSVWCDKPTCVWASFVVASVWDEFCRSVDVYSRPRCELYRRQLSRRERLWSWEQRVVCGAGSRVAREDVSAVSSVVGGSVPVLPSWYPPSDCRRGLCRSVAIGLVLVTSSLVPLSVLSSADLLTTASYCELLYVLCVLSSRLVERV